MPGLANWKVHLFVSDLTNSQVSLSLSHTHFNLIHSQEIQRRRMGILVHNNNFHSFISNLVITKEKPHPSNFGVKQQVVPIISSRNYSLKRTPTMVHSISTPLRGENPGISKFHSHFDLIWFDYPYFPSKNIMLLLISHFPSY